MIKYTCNWVKAIKGQNHLGYSPSNISISGSRSSTKKLGQGKKCFLSKIFYVFNKCVTGQGRVPVTGSRSPVFAFKYLYVLKICKPSVITVLFHYINVPTFKCCHLLLVSKIVHHCLVTTGSQHLLLYKVNVKIKSHLSNLMVIHNPSC